MNLSNTILVPCPVCKKEHPAPTQSGSCSLQTFPLFSAEAVELMGVNQSAPFTCFSCGCTFGVKALLKVDVVDLKVEMLSPPIKSH
jgi:hypothetical protein